MAAKKVSSKSRGENRDSAVRDSDEHFKSVFNAAGDAIFIHDFDGNLLEVNQVACDRLGYSKEEFFKMKLADIDSTEYAALYHKLIEEVRDKRKLIFETVHVTRDGRAIPIELSSSIIGFRGKDAVMNIARDITDRKISETALRESEDKYKNLFHHSNDAIFIHDLEGNIIDANRKALSLFGYTEAEILSMKIPQLHPPEDLEKSAWAFDKVSRDGFVSFEINFMKKEGEIFPAEVSSSLYEMLGRKIIQGIVRDITNRKREERLLRESEEKYRTLVEQSLQGLVIIQDYRIVYSNTAMSEMVGYSIGELLSKSREEIYALVHPDDQELVWGRLGDRLAGKSIPHRYELRTITKSGEIRWLEIFSNLIEYNGRPAVQVTFIDIHERKRMERTLQESEDKFRTLAEQSPNMIFINKGGKIVYANKKCEELTGYRREEFYSPDFDYLTLIASDYRDLVESNYEGHMEGGDIIVYEYAIMTKDGKRMDTIINTKMINFEGEKAILGIVTDITKLKLLEKQLHQSQKMEAIGTLAGGIAHDFNNLLIGIMGYSDLLLSKVKDDSSIRDDVIEISKAAEKAASLTKQLLAFGRRQMLQVEVLDLNDVITNMNGMLRHIVGENIGLELILDPGLQHVKADPSQLELVIINLAVNARDAMPDGGKLTIKTKNMRIDEESLNLMTEARTGDFVLLAVEDTGFGIEKENLSRVFEPFYSTKGVGVGTGLGLSSVYGNVKQHHGWIEVSSEVGKGTAFKIYLPVSSEKPVSKEEDAASRWDPIGRGEYILLVEDEERVRRFTARVLRENGYNVREAGTAEEGLEIFSREGGKFELVFSDVVLPDRSGIQLVEELLQRKPGLKVILSSGYTEQRSRLNLIHEKGFQFLHKPYSVADLLAVTGEALATD